MRYKFKLVAVYTLVTALVLSGCSTPFKKKPVDPFSGFDFNTVVVSSNKFQDPNTTVTYPSVSGLPVHSLETSINTYLQQEFVPQTTLSTEVYSAHFTVEYRAGSIIDFMNYGTDRSPADETGLPIQDSIILDVKTGNTYSLADLFLPKTNYLGALTNIIKQQDISHHLNTLQPFTGVAAYDRFYLMSDGITIFFSPLEWTPVSMGFPSYHIQFGQLQKYLNTAGPFWKDLHLTSQ